MNVAIIHIDKCLYKQQPNKLNYNITKGIVPEAKQFGIIVSIELS